MYYCEQSDDIYNHIPSKQTLFDELDRLTVHIAGEERKSSGQTTHDLNYSGGLFDQESENYEMDILNFPPEQPAQNNLPTLSYPLSCEDRANKNQTKNIPKNYGKAIFGYIQKSRSRTSRLLSQLNIDSDCFYQFMQQQSKRINSIADLRWLWNGNEFSEPIRILSYEFMRKHSLPYIFKSRIKNHLTHIKYREKFIDGLKRPDQFKNIKDY